jgi:hypothetical protein
MITKKRGQCERLLFDKQRIPSRYQRSDKPFSLETICATDQDWPWLSISGDLNVIHVKRKLMDACHISDRVWRDSASLTCLISLKQKDEFLSYTNKTAICRIVDDHDEEVIYVFQLPICDLAISVNPIVRQFSLAQA